MLLFWRIRYLDSRDGQFRDRDLWLDTTTLDSATKAAVEATHNLQDPGHGRGMLRYRQLFRERQLSTIDVNQLLGSYDDLNTVFIHDYFEDENGNEVTNQRIAVILSGKPNAVMFPARTPQYEVDYALAMNRPIPIGQISLPAEALSALGYFTRDLREMLTSAFYRDGPGKLTGHVGGEPSLQTAVSDEEIRSFVTIFRRLYMKTEPANFLKAAEVFANAVAGHPLANVIRGRAGEYQAELHSPPTLVPFAGGGAVPFTRKRLIDVFLYTQYVHQPDQRRYRQFHECLAAVGNRRPVLTWLFLTEMWACALHVRNAGVIIADFYDRYCSHHQVSGGVLDSVSKENAGIGALEKKAAFEARILREKTEELALAIWKQNGEPAGGPMQFLQQTHEQLRNAMGNSDSSS